MNDELMSPDPFFRPDVDFVSQSSADYCRMCPQSVQGGFCGVRIQPDCLRIDANGVVRVSLSSTARAWFETLAGLGEVLHLTRNAVAVLGRLGQMPVLQDWRNAAFPCDRLGLFTPNLAEYASLWAVREVSSVGVLHGLEMGDVSGSVFERVLLSERAHRELFEQFVTIHQSPPEEAGTWFPANHAWSARRRASLAGRIPWLRSRLAKGVKNVRHLPIGFVPKLLAAVATANFPIRTTHYHRALIRTVIWTPQAHEKPERDKSLSEFFHGDDVGLHLNLRAIASVWLWSGKCACCAKKRWTVEVADAHDHIGLALMAGHEAMESDWRELLDSRLR